MAKEEEAEEKAMQKAAKDDLAQPKRSQLTMAKMSGADGLRYLEYDASLSSQYYPHETPASFPNAPRRVTRLLATPPPRVRSPDRVQEEHTRTSNLLTGDG